MIIKVLGVVGVLVVGFVGCVIVAAMMDKDFYGGEKGYW